jgi:hypothetical protein
MGARTAAETGDRPAPDVWKLVLGSIGVVYGDIGTSRSTRCARRCTPPAATAWLSAR